ncbi:MAG: type IV secretory system conjugative DNA transfer family protein, partial [Pseudomonadota bacterium]|nr:type IV secretory system conjugative DNA transfer family protein [Pseudomonadota bacterium]
MTQVVLAAISGLVAFELFIQLYLPLPVAVGCFLALFVGLNLIVGGLVGGIWNSGLWTTLPMRRTVGLAADGLVVIALWWVGITIADRLDLWGWAYGTPMANNSAPDDAKGRAALAWLFWGWCALVLPLSLTTRLKVFLGKLVGPVARLVRSRFIGMGGSSQFGGLFNDWARPWKPGQLLLGSSMYSPGWKVGRFDDRHFITIATSRSGKGRSAIIPNLLTWPGSALVIDPKGQNAAVTAAARGRGGGRVKKGMGQTIRIVDPFGELKALGLDLPVHRFNPLAELDPAAPDFVEQVRSITEALVVPDARGDSFWDRATKTIINGIVAHLLTGPGIEPGAKTLYGVRHWLQHVTEEDFLKPMRANTVSGGLPAAAAAQIDQLGEDARGDVIGTAMTHTDWLDSVAMQGVLGASEFSLSELKAGATTLYLVLPSQYLGVHGRFLRLFVNLALQEVGKGRKGRHAVLFLLDEFYALGPLQKVADSAGEMAGRGVKLWPIVQNLGQLQQHYPENWEAFLGNAGMWQVFAVNDQTTARYMSERLGEHIVWRKQRTFNQQTQKYDEEWMPQGASFLRTGIELGRETSRDSGNQVIFVEGGDSFLLRRRPYDRSFKREQYSPDPYEPRASSLRGRIADWWEGLEARDAA